MRNYNLRGIYDTYDRPSRARRGVVSYLDDDGDSDDESDDDGFTKSFVYDEDGEADNRKKRKKKYGLLKKYFAFYKPTVAKSETNQKQREDGFEYITSDDDDREIKDIHYSLRYGSNVISAVSLFFWCWAMSNTRGMEKGQDLGIYSFFTTFVSSHLILFKTRNGPGGSVVATTPTRVIVTISHSLVFLNYCLGILYAFNVGNYIYVGFATYCIIFSFLWLYAAIRGYTLLSRLREYEIEIQEAEEDEDLYFLRGLT